MSANPIPPRKCRRRSCRKEFTGRDPYCSYDCAVASALESVRRNRLKRTAVARKAKREFRARTMTIAKLLALAQKEFNKFCRERDFGKPCISSGRPILASTALRGHMGDAGHYRSIGAAPHLRFNEDNCHLQSVVDNRDLSGNAVAYRQGLIARIGLARVEALENDNRTIKWNRDELVAIRRKYLGLWKTLKAKRESAYEA